MPDSAAVMAKGQPTLRYPSAVSYDRWWSRIYCSLYSKLIVLLLFFHDSNGQHNSPHSGGRRLREIRGWPIQNR